MNPSCPGNHCLAAWRWVLHASLAVALGQITALAQGTINFANLVVVNGQRVVDAPVLDGSGQLAGSGFKAQLYAGPAWSPVENLVPVGSPASFQTGTGAGYFLGGARVISSVAPGQVARVQVRVWLVASGATWEHASLRLCSNILDVRTAGAGEQPVNLIGLGPTEPTCFPESPVFVIQPQHQNAIVGNDVTLTARAVSSASVRLRWYFNGAILPGETNVVLTLQNIQQSTAGAYFAVAETPFNSAMSAIAIVSVNAQPNGPLTNITVAALPGLSLLAIPLVTSNHTVAALFPEVPNGSSIFKVDGNGFVANNYLFGWSDPAMTVVPGEAWFFRNASPTNVVLSFEGRAVAGVSTNRGTQGYFLCGSIPPTSGQLDALQYVGDEGDRLFLLEAGATNYTVFGHLLGAWLDYTPEISVGQGFWGFKEDNLNWAQTYGASNAGSYRIVQPRITSDIPEVNFFTFHTNQSFGRVFDADGVTSVSAGFVGQLYVGPSEGSLTPIGNPAPFLSNSGAGYVAASSVSLPDFSNGQTVYAQLRVWETGRCQTYEIASAQAGARSGKSAVVAIVAHAPLTDYDPRYVFLPGLPPNNFNTFPSFALGVTQPPLPPTGPSNSVQLVAAPGLSLLSVPFVTSNHTVAALFPDVPNGASIFKIDADGFVANNYLFGWSDPYMTLIPGEGWFFRNPTSSNLLLRVEGREPIGTLTNVIPGGLSLLSSIATGCDFIGFRSDPDCIGTPGTPHSGDVVFKFNSQTYESYSWFFGSWIPSAPSLCGGEGFFYHNADCPHNWVQIVGEPPAGGFRLTHPTLTGAVPEINFLTYHTNSALGRVFEADNTMPVSSAFVGQLYVGTNQTFLRPIGVSVPFQSGLGAGYIRSDSVQLPGIRNPESVFVQLRVWEASRGSTYESAATNIGAQLGKSQVVSLMANAPTSGERLPGFPPNNVNNFPSFAVGYPASAILDLDIVGQDVRLQIVTAEGPRYRLETATSLDPNEQWNPVGSVGEFTGTGGTVSVTHPGGATQQQRFYRVVEVSGGQ